VVEEKMKSLAIAFAVLAVVLFGTNPTQDEYVSLAFIRRARELGFGIDDIRALLALAEPQHVSCAQVREIAAAHLWRRPR
jgi:MerR, DNA binding